MDFNDPNHDLPFQLLEVIGRGSFGSVRHCIRHGEDIAVKFINVRKALNSGFSQRKIDREVTLHQVAGREQRHQNVLQFYQSSLYGDWRWIAMEFARGGDLFDKIEPDVGLTEDAAHFYFTQLIDAVAFLHSHGISHRDVKPENIFLNEHGNLKLGDFGLADLFEYKGSFRRLNEPCGSPPYVAPEISGSYYGDRVDVWSCGIVLFTLLIGNTPWDEPSSQSPEFYDYSRRGGKGVGQPWDRLPHDAVSLLRGMMKIDSDLRLTTSDIMAHPWYRRTNTLLDDEEGVNIATALMKNLYVDLREDDPSPVDMAHSYAPQDNKVHLGSLPDDRDWGSVPMDFGSTAYQESSLREDPVMLQYSRSKDVQMKTMTQKARRFDDICPPTTLAEFWSRVPLSLVYRTLSDALHRLGITVPDAPVPQHALNDIQQNTLACFVINHIDSRKCALSGEIIITKFTVDTDSMEEGERKSDPILHRVTFHKRKGDNLEWRRFFKKIAFSCRQIVFTAN